MFELPYCSSSFRTGLGSKLSTEKHVPFLRKKGALFEHLGTGTYIYWLEETFFCSC